MAKSLREYKAQNSPKSKDADMAHVVDKVESLSGEQATRHQSSESQQRQQ
jgi:hypothetical protein